MFCRPCQAFAKKIRTFSKKDAKFLQKALLFVIIAVEMRNGKGKDMRTVRLGVWLLLIFFALSGCHAATERTFSIVFLDVGQGNATLLQTPDGDVLVDCGPESAQETLCRKLKARGVQTLKFLILTHPDEDHIGGADVILEQFSVDAILYNGGVEESESFARFLAAAAQKNLPVTALDRDDEAILEDLKITVLHPEDRTDPGEGNKGSLVLRAEYRGLSVLFTGDADESVEKLLLQGNAARLSAMVLQVGHHGAATSSSSEFLQAVSPSVAVISCGAGNRYGHPDGRVLERLRGIGATVYRTDLEGDIVLLWNGETLQKQE